MKVIRSYLVIKTGLKLFIYLVLFFERHCGLQSLPVGGANAPKLTRGRRGRRSPGWVRGRCVCEHERKRRLLFFPLFPRRSGSKRVQQPRLHVAANSRNNPSSTAPE